MKALPQIKVPARLAALGKLYASRNKLYGNDYMTFGAFMMATFPKGVTLKSEDDFTRFALFQNMSQKFTRYGKNFFLGGHVDSLDDISVYAQMLQEADHAIANRRLAKLRSGRRRPDRKAK